MTSIWDDPELHTGDNFFSFDHPGDTLQGRIEIIKKQVWADGTTSPQLFITDATTGQEVVLSAGQIQLKNKLVAERPEPGDDIWIQFTRVEPRGGGKTLKHFDVRIRRNNAGPGYRPQTNQQPPQQGGGFGGQPPQAPGPQGGFGGQPQQQPAAYNPIAAQQGGDPWGGQQPQPGATQQYTQPAQAPGPQPPAQQQQLPADDPWGAPAAPQQPTQGGYGNPGEPPF